MSATAQARPTLTPAEKRRRELVRHREVLVEMRDYFLQIRAESPSCEGDEEGGPCPFEAIAEPYRHGLWVPDSERIAAIEESIKLIDVHLEIHGIGPEPVEAAAS